MIASPNLEEVNESLQRLLLTPLCAGVLRRALRHQGIFIDTTTMLANSTAKVMKQMEDGKAARATGAFISGYLGPFSPRYGPPTARGPRLRLAWTADAAQQEHTPGGLPVDEPPPFPKPPAPEGDPPREPVAPPVI